MFKFISESALIVLMLFFLIMAICEFGLSFYEEIYLPHKQRKIMEERYKILGEPESWDEWIESIKKDK